VMPVGCIPEKTMQGNFDLVGVVLSHSATSTVTLPPRARPNPNPPPAEGDVPAAPSQLPVQYDDLTEQEKVRITLKFNFVRFPTSSRSINTHASLESIYARLRPLS